MRCQPAEKVNIQRDVQAEVQKGVQGVQAEGRVKGALQNEENGGSQKTLAVGTSRYALYLLYWYKSGDTAVRRRWRLAGAGTQFTRIPGTTVQILTRGGWRQ
jgi:hypothetical protein